MNFNALSMFASAGIAETYFARHGVHVKVASELLAQRAKFHEHLYPDAKMICGDITQDDIFKRVITAARAAKVNFILATPPCQGMSSAGKQKRDDFRNRLILPVIDSIDLLRPKFVIIENVPELLQTKIKIDGRWVLISDYLHARLDNQYSFNERNVVNAMFYKVPQSRERCVFLLSRRDQHIQWEFPKPSKKVMTMRDAIGGLPSLDPEVIDLSDEERAKVFPHFEQKKAAGLAVSKWHFPPRHYWRHVVAMMHTPEGHSAWENKTFCPKLKNGKRGKGYKNTYKRQWWDKPAYTVTMFTSRIGSQENGHPGYALNDSADEETRIWSDPRTMTVYELMLLSSLPKKWSIPDWATNNLVREIIGEGVPPRLLEAALKSLERVVDGK